MMATTCRRWPETSGRRSRFGLGWRRVPSPSPGLVRRAKVGNPQRPDGSQFDALCENTVSLGLQRAGLPQDLTAFRRSRSGCSGGRTAQSATGLRRRRAVWMRNCSGRTNASRATLDAEVSGGHCLIDFGKLIRIGQHRDQQAIGKAGEKQQ